MVLGVESGSSTHTGRPRFRVPRAPLPESRHQGEPPPDQRGEGVHVELSGASAGANVITPPTCMARVRSSANRKDASSGDRRSGTRPSVGAVGEEGRGPHGRWPRIAGWAKRTVRLRRGSTPQTGGAGRTGAGRKTPQGGHGAAHLDGAEDMETPYWALSQLDAAQAGIRAVAEGARTAAALIGWSWRRRPAGRCGRGASARTAVATAFGLLRRPSTSPPTSWQRARRRSGSSTRCRRWPWSSPRWWHADHPVRERSRAGGGTSGSRSAPRTSSTAGSATSSWPAFDDADLTTLVAGPSRRSGPALRRADRRRPGGGGRLRWGPPL